MALCGENQVQTYRPCDPHGRTSLSTFRVEAASLRDLLRAETYVAKVKSSDRAQKDLLTQREVVEIDAISDVLDRRRFELEPAVVEQLEAMIDRGSPPFIDDVIDAWVMAKNQNVKTNRELSTHAVGGKNV
jgi:hypothetical protein